MKNQKITIIGAGPAGLTLAWLLSPNNKVTIIDKQASIGGCHASDSNYDDRKIQNFSEHGPRVYSGRSKYFVRWLGDMGLKWDQLFKPYKFQISQIGGFTKFTAGEILSFAKRWFMSTKVNKTTSMADFMREAGFTATSTDYVDRLCRLTDGADSTRYSVWKFLQLVNQQYLYTLYQPIKPNNMLMMSLIKDKLINRGVKFMLATTVASIDKTTISTDKGSVEADQIILACPPQQMYKILDKSKLLWCLPNLSIDYLKNNSYNHYISISFTWDIDVLGNTKRTWGFPATQHGLIHIIMSDYWNSSNTVISTALTINDDIKNLPDADLIEIAFNELKQSYPNLTKPTQSIINKKDLTAFIQGINPENLGPKTLIPNLYTVGTHNGVSDYAFTSIDTAVESAYKFVDPSINITSVTINMLLVFVLMLVLILAYIKLYTFKVPLYKKEI